MQARKIYPNAIPGLAIIVFGAVWLSEFRSPAFLENPGFPKMHPPPRPLSW
jgi:hypothetical protein